MILERADFCRHCGASESSGWADTSEHYAGTDEDDFDYDEFIANEFPDASQNIKRDWKSLVVILVLVGFLLAFVLSC